MVYDWKKIKSSVQEDLSAQDSEPSQLELIVFEEGMVEPVDNTFTSPLLDLPHYTVTLEENPVLQNPTYISLFDIEEEVAYKTETGPFDTYVVEHQEKVASRIEEQLSDTNIKGRDEEFTQWCRDNPVLLMLYHNMHPLSHDNVDYG